MHTAAYEELLFAPDYLLATLPESAAICFVGTAAGSSRAPEAHALPAMDAACTLLCRLSAIQVPSECCLEQRVELRTEGIIDSAQACGNVL